MQSNALVRQIILLRAVPPSTLTVTALASVAGLGVAIAGKWPLWALGLATVLPWVPSITAQAAWTEQYFQGLALFYVLVVTQVGHLFEHVSQMVEIHVLGIPALAARGIFGALDVEWVHFAWNSGVIAIVVILLLHFRQNPWLILTAALAGWHEVEHLYIMAAFLSSNVPGGPGLLAAGGAIGGGLPLTRPDLHFLYNLVETTPLVIAFGYQAKRLFAQSVAPAV